VVVEGYFVGLDEVLFVYYCVVEFECVGDCVYGVFYGEDCLWLFGILVGGDDDCVGVE